MTLRDELIDLYQKRYIDGGAQVSWLMETIMDIVARHPYPGSLLYTKWCTCGHVGTGVYYSRARVITQPGPDCPKCGRCMIPTGKMPWHQ